MDYRKLLYTSYHTTHTAPREGKASRDSFRRKAVSYDRIWKPLFPADKAARIIDIGCGDGSLLWWLQQSGYANSEGIDTSEEQVRVADAIGVSNVQRADAHEFLADGADSYDVVILRDVLEHFLKPEVLQLLQLIHHALRPNGMIIVQVPNAESPLFARIRYGDFTHELAFSESSLKQIFAATGFVGVRFYPCHLIKVTNIRSFVRLVVWRLAEAFYRMLLFGETGRRKWIVTTSMIATGIKE